MNTFLLIGIWIVGILLLLIFVLLLYRTYLKTSTKINTPNGISSLEEISLGGIKQWIFVRGFDQNNPLLLFLHGGPGVPLFGMSSSRKYDSELIKHFTVVHWDQRGAGKSFNNNIPVNSMTLDRFVEDCKELIDYLCVRFQVNKLFLVGHSAGTAIGIKTASKYPEKLNAYVGVAQVINDYEQQKIAYDFMVKEAEKSGHVRRLNAIKTIGPPPYESPDRFLEQSGHIGHYGGFLYDTSIKQYLRMAIVMLNFITSPEYSLLEGIRTIRYKGMDFSQNAMWKELININFTEEIRSINVPIYFFEGKYDMTNSTVVVENFYNKLTALKGKNLIIFEKSAHLPMIEEKEKYEYILVNEVLKNNQG